MPHDIAISEEEFEAFRGLIHQVAGIALSRAKIPLLTTRLMRRLRHHGFEDFGTYYEYLKHYDRDGSELLEMVNAVTTNKTSFFREAHHFEFVRRTLATRLILPGAPRRLTYWCAGCSTGEEPYTLAISLSEILPPAAFKAVRILASDIDTAVLKQAEEGLYPLEAIAELEDHVKRAGFLRGVGSYEGQVRVRPELQAGVVFRRINLVEPAWPVRGPFDAVFCRNVLIYFDRDTQRQVVERFATVLAPGGHLFLGHSENLFGLTDLFEPLGNTTYRVRGGAAAGSGSRG